MKMTKDTWIHEYTEKEIAAAYQLWDETYNKQLYNQPNCDELLAILRQQRKQVIAAEVNRAMREACAKQTVTFRRG